MKVVIFDNDGVVMKPIENFLDKLVKERDLDKSLVDKFFLERFFPLCMTGKADLKKELERELPLWGIEDSVEEILNQWFRFESKLNEEVIFIIRRLRDSGIKCFLATNNEKYRTNYLKKNLHYDDLFDGVFSSADLDCKKPDKLFYTKVFREIEKIGISLDKVYYVDDDLENVIAGTKFGFNSYNYDFNDHYGFINWLKSLKLIQ